MTTKIHSEIKRLKQRLSAKARKNGVWENFGQDEVRRLEDAYRNHQYAHDGVWDAIRKFDEWCQTYTGEPYCH